MPQYWLHLPEGSVCSKLLLRTTVTVRLDQLLRKVLPGYRRVCGFWGAVLWGGFRALYNHVLFARIRLWGS